VSQDHQLAGGYGYGSGVRLQVFEVVVRQALAGAPWQEICAGPMQVNSISEYEIKEEIKRRRGDGNGSQPAGVPNKPKRPNDHTGVELPLPSQANSE
jgi:hypothetical protein